MLVCTNLSGVHGLEENERNPGKMKHTSTVRHGQKERERKKRK
jgi:hypothetical protein